MGCRLNRLDEPVVIAVAKPLLSEFGIHHRLESYVAHLNCLTESQTEVRKSSPEWMRVTKMQNRNEMKG